MGVLVNVYYERNVLLYDDEECQFIVDRRAEPHAVHCYGSSVDLRAPVAVSVLTSTLPASPHCPQIAALAMYPSTTRGVEVSEEKACPVSSYSCITA